MTIPSIPSSISAAAGQANLLATLAGGMIAFVRPETPGASQLATDTLPAYGVSGFVFNISQTQEITIESDITDHYVEDNAAMQDHIALKPRVIVLSGLVAEVDSDWNVVPPGMSPEDFDPSAQSRNLSPPSIEGQVAAAISTLDPVQEMIPDVCNAARDAYNQATQVAAVANKILNLGNSPAGIFQQSHPADYAASLTRYQTKAFNFFNQIILARALVTAETPWGLMTGMAIQSFRISQDETTRTQSTVTLTLRQIRVAGTATVMAGAMKGRAAGFNSPPANTGALNGTPLQEETTPSALYKGVTSIFK